MRDADNDGKYLKSLSPHLDVKACNIGLYWIIRAQQLEAMVMEWVSVEDRLPEHLQYVLCIGTDWQINWCPIVAQYDNDERKDEAMFINADYPYDKLLPTHWMPLPEQPK